MRVRRVYADAQGASHFAEVGLDFPATEFVPSKPVIGLSAPYATTGMAFGRVPPDWAGGWHPTPRRQFVVVLAGVLEVRTSDGQAERFAPGAVFLLEDTTGEGHHTQILDGSEAMVLFVWLDPPQEPGLTEPRYDSGAASLAAKQMMSKQGAGQCPPKTRRSWSDASSRRWSTNATTTSSMR